MLGAATTAAMLGHLLALQHQDARASELLLGAALYPASQALRLGIVDELLAPEKFTETVLRRAAPDFDP